MNILLQWGGHPAVDRLGWTLLHFLWQGAVIAALFAVAQTGLRRRSSHARYWTGCLALALMLAAPVITFIALGAERTVPAALAQGEAQRRFVGDLLDRLFNGSAHRLVLQALSTKKASAAELAEIRRLLDDMEKGGK